MGTFSTCLFWVPSNDSQRPRRQARPRSNHLHIRWLLLSYSGKQKERRREDGETQQQASDRESNRRPVGAGIQKAPGARKFHPELSRFRLDL